MRVTKRMELPDRTPLGLGCWAFGGKGWGGQSERDACEVMETAFEKGIRHFDTARGYGVSEKLVGGFIKDKREDIFLASKVFPGSNPESIREALELSLRSLDTDYIDLYYLHWPREGMDPRPQVEELEKAREAGLIGSIGVSNYNREQLRLVREVAPVAFIQVGYHLFWRIIEKDLLPYCREQKIRLIAYSTLGQGILTGKFPESPRFPKGDHRPGVVHFHPDVWPHVHSAVHKVKSLARSVNRPPSHLALQWCAAQAGVSGVLAGARNRRQMLENAEAFSDPLDNTVLEELTRISDELAPCLPDQNTIFTAHP